MSARMESLALCAVGDVMLGDHPVRFGRGVRTAIDRIGIEEFLRPARTLFSGSDLVIGNLEAMLSETGRVPGALIKDEMRGRPAFASALLAAGFGALNVANNHALHHGERVFAETCAMLRGTGILVVGEAVDRDGPSACQEFMKDGLRYGLLGYSCRPEQYSPQFKAYARGDDAGFVAQVAALAKQYAGLIVSIHWGEEYLQVPSPQQLELGHRLIDAGATLILGHHPHVLQGIEAYKHGLIAYSLGNFVFDDWQRSRLDTMALKCTITDRRITSWEYLPVVIGKGFQPMPAAGADASRIRTLMTDLSRRVLEFSGAGKSAHAADELRLAYRKMAERAYQSYRMDSYRHFALNLWRYSPSTIKQSFTRAAERRKQSAEPNV
jgi:gamma-polyglutamate biosynthesis protein CapA